MVDDRLNYELLTQNDYESEITEFKKLKEEYLKMIEKEKSHIMHIN